METSLLVLANSYKNHHRCIAGIDLGSGKWIRPLSRKTPGGEVSQVESSISGGVQPRLLDVVEIDTSPISAEKLNSVHRKIVGLIQCHGSFVVTGCSGGPSRVC